MSIGQVIASPYSIVKIIPKLILSTTEVTARTPTINVSTNSLAVKKTLVATTQNGPNCFNYLLMKANKNTKPLILIISLLTIIVILLGIILFFQTPNNSEIPIAPSEQAPHPTPTAQTPIEKNEKSIAIPGYESLTLKADTKEQELSLKNPEQNTCYFVITLTLEDGTELWRSEYIEAGAVSKPIVLNQALSAGSYPALLKYECYRMDENKTPLNGAETKLTLRVK